jgi:hypothetical protein
VDIQRRYPTTRTITFIFFILFSILELVYRLLTERWTAKAMQTTVLPNVYTQWRQKYRVHWYFHNIENRNGFFLPVRPAQLTIPAHFQFTMPIWLSQIGNKINTGRSYICRRTLNDTSYNWWTRRLWPLIDVVSWLYVYGRLHSPWKLLRNLYRLITITRRVYLMFL